MGLGGCLGRRPSLLYFWGVFFRGLFSIMNWIWPFSWKSSRILGRDVGRVLFLWRTWSTFCWSISRKVIKLFFQPTWILSLFLKYGSPADLNLEYFFKMWFSSWVPSHLCSNLTKIMSLDKCLAPYKHKLIVYPSLNDFFFTTRRKLYFFTHASET